MTSDGKVKRWKENPFFVLEVPVDASRPEVERAGQRLLGLLGIGSESAVHYPSPLGEGVRDTDMVRAALAELRDPNRRVAHEIWARIGGVSADAMACEDAVRWVDGWSVLGWHKIG